MNGCGWCVCMLLRVIGAEIEGLVRSAASFAFSRNIDSSALKAVDASSLAVEWQDFERALSEVRERKRREGKGSESRR